MGKQVNTFEVTTEKRGKTMPATMQTTDEIVKGAEKFAYKIGLRQGTLFDDVVQEFCLGAVDGLSKVDTERHGARSFVWKYATGTVMKFLDKSNRQTMHKISHIINVIDLDDSEHTTDTLTSECHRPGLDDLTKGCDSELSVDDILGDTKAIDPSSLSEHQDTSEKVARAIESLPANQQEVIRGRYFADETLQVIANRMQVSKEYVRQLQDKAEETLRVRLA
jgi:RNA polymerase sigma factor (sigma-70 family)